MSAAYFCLLCAVYADAAAVAVAEVVRRVACVGADVNAMLTMLTDS